MTTATKIYRAGDSFHLLASMTIPYSEAHSAVVHRGQNVVITAEMIELSKDRAGITWLDLLHDEEAQLAKWGQVLIAPGEAPEDVLWHNAPGDTVSAGFARENALHVARQITDPVQRAEKIAAINKKFGAKPTSFVMATFKGDAPGSYSPGATS